MNFKSNFILFIKNVKKAQKNIYTYIIKIYNFYRNNFWVNIYSTNYKVK